MRYQQSHEASVRVLGLKLLRWPNGLLYLIRFILFRFNFGLVYLHRIVRADPDRHVHNHPWRAWCFVLSGGYSETIVEHPSGDTYVRVHCAGDVNELRPNEYHRIVDVLPGTWTLVIATRRFRRWGFLVDGQHVDADEYLSQTSLRKHRSLHT